MLFYCEYSQDGKGNSDIAKSGNKVKISYYIWVVTSYNLNIIKVVAITVEKETAEDTRRGNHAEIPSYF